MKGRWVASIIIALVIIALSSVAAFAQTAVGPNIYRPGGGDFAFADPAFQRLWTRIDLPFRDHKVNRSWYWGPAPNSVALLEPYKNDATGDALRLVQYFDKNRMEINNPRADSSNAFNFVTNGLLSVELISGFMQIGTNSYVRGNDACIPMTGDAGDSLAPTYFAFRGVSNTRAGDHNALDRTGLRPTQTINNNGVVSNDASKANMTGTNFVHYENHHNIPKVFWDFLHASGPVYLDNGQSANQQLVNPWFFASGLPISEPYWAKATIRGKTTDVMIQAFERIVLTYTPTNLKGWEVEMGNIGQHYFNWRYSTFGKCPGPIPAVTPQVIIVATQTATPIVTAPPTVAPPRSGTPTSTPIRTNTPTPRPSTPPSVVPPSATIRPPTQTPIPTEPEHATRTFTPTSTPPFTVTATHTPLPPKTKTPTFTFTHGPEYVGQATPVIHSARITQAEDCAK